MNTTQSLVERVTTVLTTLAFAAYRQGHKTPARKADMKALQDLINSASREIAPALAGTCAGSVVATLDEIGAGAALSEAQIKELIDIVAGQVRANVRVAGPDAPSETLQ